MRWFRIGSVAFIVVGVAHLLGHFAIMPIVNVCYPAIQDPDAWKILSPLRARSSGELVNGFSLWYSLFFFGFGSVCLVILKHASQIPAAVFRKAAAVNSGVMLVGSIVSFRYFFWYPAMSTCICGLLFFYAYLQLGKPAFEDNSDSRSRI
jgi:hypothetical protein